MQNAADDLKLTYMLLPENEVTLLVAAADEEDDDEYAAPEGTGRRYKNETSFNKSEASELASIYYDFVYQKVIPFGKSGTAKSWAAIVNNKGRSIWTGSLWFKDFLAGPVELAYTLLEHRKNVATTAPGASVKRQYALTEDDKKAVIAFFHSRYIKTAPAEHPSFTGHAFVVAVLLRVLLMHIKIRAGLAPRGMDQSRRLLAIPFVDHIDEAQALKILEDAEADVPSRKYFHLVSKGTKLKSNDPELKIIINWTGRRGKAKASDIEDPLDDVEEEIETKPKSPHDSPASPRKGVTEDALAPKAGEFTRTAPTLKAGEGPAETTKLEKDVSEVLKVLYDILAEANANHVFEGSTGEVFATKFLNVIKDRKFPKTSMKRPDIEGTFAADDKRVVDWCASFVTSGLMSDAVLTGTLNGVARQSKAIEVLTGMAVDANAGEGAAETPAAKAAYAARLVAIQGLFKKWLASSSSTTLDKTLDTAIKKAVKDFRQEPFIDDEKPAAKKPASKAKKAKEKDPVKEKPAAKKPASKAKKPASKAKKPAAKASAAKKSAAKKPAAKKAAAKKPASKKAAPKKIAPKKEKKVAAKASKKRKH